MANYMTIATLTYQRQRWKKNPRNKLLTPPSSYSETEEEKFLKDCEKKIVVKGARRQMAPMAIRGSSKPKDVTYQRE